MVAGDEKIRFAKCISLDDLINIIITCIWSTYCSIYQPITQLCPTSLLWRTVQLDYNSQSSWGSWYLSQLWAQSGSKLAQLEYLSWDLTDNSDTRAHTPAWGLSLINNSSIPFLTSLTSPGAAEDKSRRKWCKALDKEEGLKFTSSMPVAKEKITVHVLHTSSLGSSLGDGASKGQDTFYLQKALGIVGYDGWRSPSLFPCQESSFIGENLIFTIAYKIYLSKW